MQTTTASAEIQELGPLSRIVLRFSGMVEERATASGGAIDWTPLSAMVAPDFKRVGAYMEELDWTTYTAFLSEWAGTTRFEATVFHMTEIGRAVFQEIEERHWHGEEFIRKNVIAVWRFDDQDRIHHLDIYEQAQDSGRWIVEAATRG